LLFNINEVTETSKENINKRYIGELFTLVNCLHW